MKKLMCYIFQHSWRLTTRSKSISGVIKNYYKCNLCGEKIKVETTTND